MVADPVLLGVDPRLRHIDVLQQDVPAAGPGAPAHAAGALITFIDGAIDAEGRYLTFVSPSASALALNSSINGARTAQSKRTEVEFNISSSPWGESLNAGLDQAGALFDFFEAYFNSALFSFVAIEAYCNEVMENFAHTQIEIPIQRCGKRRTAKLEVRSLERKATAEKLGLILPHVLQVPTPRGKAMWPKFLKLQQIRNDIVHAKADDVFRRVQSENDRKRPTLFFRSFNDDVEELPKTAVEVISYFAENWRTPSWLAHCRQQVGLSPLR